MDRSEELKDEHTAKISDFDDEQKNEREKFIESLINKRNNDFTFLKSKMEMEISCFNTAQEIKKKSFVKSLEKEIASEFKNDYNNEFEPLARDYWKKRTLFIESHRQERLIFNSLEYEYSYKFLLKLKKKNMLLKSSDDIINKISESNFEKREDIINLFQDL